MSPDDLSRAAMLDRSNAEARALMARQAHADGRYDDERRHRIMRTFWRRSEAMHRQLAERETRADA